MSDPAPFGDADSPRSVGNAPAGGAAPAAGVSDSPAGVERFGPHPGLVFDEAGVPYDAQYGDVFRNRNGAWEEAETVFVGGCRLRERWQARERFTVFELGFGLGVNFLTTLRVWRADPRRCATLHFVSVESRPLSRVDLRRGLAALGAVESTPVDPASSDCESLLAGWPAALPGLHRIVFADGAVTLTLAFGDAQRIVPRLSLAADAIFLDGFAPSRNPQMWSPALMRAVARLACADARLATWSTAAALRDALSTVGFETTRMPGTRGKRHRLEAVRVARPTRPTRTAHQDTRSFATSATGGRHVLVIGAGLAGSAVAEGFARRGFDVDVLDARESPGGEGSSQPVCADHLHLSPDDNPLARLSRAALLLRGEHTEPVARGRLLVDDDAAAGERVEAMLARLGFPASFARRVGSDEASDLAGIRIPRKALWQPACAAIAPDRAIRAALARRASGTIRFVGNAAVARLDHDPAGLGWVARDAVGRVLGAAPVVVLANAGDAPRLGGLASLPLQRARGQSTWLNEPALAGLGTVLGGMAYACPSGAGDGRLLVGASFGKSASPLPDPDDDAANLQRLGRMLGVAHRSMAANAAPAAVGFRYVLPDHLPAIGALPDEAAAAPIVAALAANDRLPIPVAPGIYGAFGFGSRGLLWAALAAELLPALVCGEPAPIERDLVDAVSPARFLRRQLRRRGRIAPD